MQEITLLFLYYYESFRSREIDYLAMFLNFCLPTWCRKQATYQAILTMFSENIGDEKGMKMLRRVMGHLRGLQAHRPKSYQALFQSNLKTLLHDLKLITGNRLDI